MVRSSESSEDGESSVVSPQRRDTRITLEPSFTASDLTEEEDEDEEEVKPQSAGPWWSTLVSGGVAGAVSRTSVAPLERIKILFQVQGLSAKGAPLRHVGIFESLVNLYQKEGVRGLWKGNGMNCVRVVPSSAIQFASYRLYKNLLFGDDGSGQVHLDTWMHVVAGGLAGATSTTLTYPLDLMRARRTVDFRGDVPMGMFSGLKHIWRTEGPRGMYRGVVPSLCGIVPYIGIDFAVYDLLKKSCKKRGWGLVNKDDKHQELTALTKLGCGCFAGCCGMTIAFPFDTARRNLQVATLKVRSPEQPVPHHFVDVLAGIIREGGVRALYRGIFPNYLKAAPSVGISFATFETVKPLFEHHADTVVARRQQYFSALASSSSKEGAGATTPATSADDDNNR